MVSDSLSGILRVGVLNAVHNIDPTTAHDTESMFVARQVFESPFEVDAGTTEIQPQLAAAPLEPIAGTELPTYRLRLRDDVLFSDGTPLGIDDALDSLRRADVLTEQADVDRDGDLILLRLKNANARIDLSLSHGQCCVARRVDGSVFGTGPFRVAENSTADLVRLERNPHHRPPAGPEEVHLRVYPLDAEGRPTPLIRAVEAGEVDLTTALPRDEITALGGVRKSITPGISTALLYLNHESPKLADPRTRQAIAHGIDRLEVAKTCYTNALAFAATSVLPRPLGAVDDQLTFEPDDARRLLAEAGGPPGPLRMLVTWGPRAYVPHPQRVGEEVCRQLAKMGIEIEIEVPPSVGDFFDAVFRGDRDLVLAGWVADTMDPCDFLESILASSRVPTLDNITVGANHGRLRSAAMDSALARLRGKRSAESFHQVMSLLATEATVVPLMYGASATVSSFRLHNVRPTPLAHFPLADITFG